MTIRTQQLKVANVLFPICKTTAPVPLLCLRLYLSARIEMMDGKYTQVAIATDGTLAAKGTQEFNLALPSTPSLLQHVAILVPVSLLALGRTEPKDTRLPAVLTLSVVCPSRVEVAGLAAVLGPGRKGRIESLPAGRANSLPAVLGSVCGESRLAEVPRATTSGRTVDLIGSTDKRVPAGRAYMLKFSHACIVRECIARVKSGYFAIAKRRIEQAQAQMIMALE
jgi:hypothetical protein